MSKQKYPEVFVRTLANLHLWPSPSNAAKQMPPKEENLGFQSRGPRISTQNNVPKQKNILEESKLMRDLLAAGG